MKTSQQQCQHSPGNYVKFEKLNNLYDKSFMYLKDTDEILKITFLVLKKGPWPLLGYCMF